MPEYDFLVGTFNTPHIYTLTFTLPDTTTTATASADSGAAASLKITKRHDAIGSHSWLHLTPPFNTANPTPAQPRGQSTIKRRNLYATAWTEPPSVVAYTIESPTSIKLLGQGRTKTRSGYVTASENAVYSAGGATGEVFAIDPATGGFVSPSSPPSLVSTQPTATATATATTASSSHNSSLSSTPQPSSEVSSSSSLSSSTTTTATSSSSSSIVEPLQVISFVDATGSQKDDGSVMDFGGLRHGAHSADLSPDGSLLYVADIGRNAIWTYTVDTSSSSSQKDGKGSGSGSASGRVALAQKLISPRSNDGPRHVWPHPAGKVVYVLQEHSSHVDIFDVVINKPGAAAAVELKHAGGVRIIPDGFKEQDFWADEVRNSLSHGDSPRWIYASTRGLEASTKGWLAVFAVDADGHVDGDANPKSGGIDAVSSKPVALWETPTSGGWANAIQPGPTVEGVEYLALTDSEQGWVFVVSWDGKEIKEVARQQLDPGAGAATAVWL